MLRALAARSRGLTTPELAEKCANPDSSWVNALGTVRQLMLKQQKQGRVELAGWVDGDRTRPVALWRITSEGRRYVEEADAAEYPVPEAAPVTPGSSTAQAGLALLLWAQYAAAERERAAREHRQALSRMLEGFWDLILACAYGEEFDAERAFAYVEDAILYYAQGKIASGDEPTQFERGIVEERIAEYQEEVS